MPRKNQGEFADLAGALMQELDQDAAVLADELFGEIGANDGVQVSAREMADYVKHGWLQPEFRTKLLEQLGPRKFLETVTSAFGVKLPRGEELESWREQG